MDDNGILHWLICTGYFQTHFIAAGEKDWSHNMVPCEKKLLKHNIIDGHIEIKCHKCSTTNVYHKTLGETNEPI